MWLQNQFAHKANWVCACSLSALTIKYIDERIKIIKPLPAFLLSALHLTFSVAWFLFLPLQKQFKWFYRPKKGGVTKSFFNLHWKEK
jgi:hypothetical protein